MPSFRTGTVTAMRSERPGLQRVDVDDRPAFVLTQLTGPVAVGDRVVVNTTAVDLGLGTGGWDVVHWNLAREQWSAPGPGHIMKLRYTSLQADTGTAEEAPGYAPPADLGGLPVVACALHSQLPCVAAVVRHLLPGARLAYVMTDSGALPLALSDLVAALEAAGLVDVTVTAGHAFGGHHEAVNVRSALDVAALAGADVAVVAPGPGVVGTSTPHGFSALEVATVVDLAAKGGGRPVVPLRFSAVDRRPRHQGVSRQSLVALAHAHASALVPVPIGEPVPDVGDHEVVAVDVPPVADLLSAAGVAVATMGRGPDEDPGFFAYAGAGGVGAVRALGGRG